MKNIKNFFLKIVFNRETDGSQKMMNAASVLESVNNSLLLVIHNIDKIMLLCNFRQSLFAQVQLWLRCRHPIQVWTDSIYKKIIKNYNSLSKTFRTSMWKASAPSSSALDIDMKAIPSDPTVIDFPVHWPLIKSPLFNFIMIYV